MTTLTRLYCFLLLIEIFDTNIENICLTYDAFPYYFCIVNEQRQMTGVKDKSQESKIQKIKVNKVKITN